MPTPITTGPARIVWGNPINGRPKIDQNNRPVLDDQGKQITQWAFGIAIPKADFGPLWQAMTSEAQTVFPQGVPANFAWKIKDGDGLDDQGKPFNTREGYAGCYVLSVSTESFAPRVVRLNGGAYSDMTEGIKTGDYVRVALNLKAHSGKLGTRGSMPGIYVNPVMVEFLGYGEAIQHGPDAMAVFGGQTVALPPGASAVPLAPQGNMPVLPMPAAMPGVPLGNPTHHAPRPGFAPAVVPGGMNYAATAQPVHTTTAYPSNVPPAHDFVTNAAPGMMGTPPTIPAHAGMPGFPSNQQSR